MKGAVIDSSTARSASAIAPRRGFFGGLFGAYSWIARRELLACALLFFLALGTRVAILAWRPPPLPTVVDEFAYLLGADTFASGRLANPPHPMWEHFETFHELMQPVYASKYPPLQSLVLAFGEKFFGEPWVGVLFSSALMCAAICWMLQGWLTPNLAFLGGLLALLRFGVFSYWMNSYWGGAVAAIGGAMLLGALPRLWRRQTTGYWIALACGLAILMHSRPWEGLVLAVLTLGVLAWRLQKAGLLSPGLFKNGLLKNATPAIAILLVSFSAVAYFDHRLTGNAFLMPHRLYDRQYLMAPDFAFLPLGPEPVYRHAEIRSVYATGHVMVWTFSHDRPFAAILDKAVKTYDFYFGFWPVMLLPLLWPYRLKTVEERVTVFLLVAFFAIAIFPQSGFMVHYTAPAAALLYVRFMQTLARWSAWRPWGKPLGAIAAGFFVMLFGVHFFTSVQVRLQPDGMPAPTYSEQRDQVAKRLAQLPGRQLVLVRYALSHEPTDEWVWNRADIDGSQTVWARAMDPAKDRELIDYYHDRNVWMLQPDVLPLRLVPYSAEPSTR